MTTDRERESPTIKVAITGEEDQGGERPDSVEQTLIAGRYRIVRRIGKGGMGEVMAARDEQVGRDVAIKRMRSANPSERAVARFLREASVQGRLEHPAIVPVHEIGRDADQLPFFVMKKLTGTSLAQILGEDRAKFPLQDVLRAFTDVCLAVEFAHVRGIVHRDLKPDNIMLGDFGDVYILDWGVAKVVGEPDGDFGDVDSGSGEHATAAGTAIGTPGYMAPEQVRGAPDIDGRADIYTLGCLLFEILAGEALHPRGFHGLESALRGGDTRPSTRTGAQVPPELDSLVVHATHKDRAQRIQSARELGERVQRFLEGDRDTEARRQIAERHLARAKDAFAGDDRGVAMREAASALALDPQLTAAAELVGRLMLEPPTAMPAAVQDAIAEDDARSTRAVVRAGLWVIVASLLYLPLLYWLGPRDIRYLEGMAGLLALDGLLGLQLVRSRRPRPEFILIANTLIVLVVSRMFSPLLVAPGLGAVIAMAMVLTPQYSRLGSSLVVALLMIGACLMPLLLEQVGVISPTMAITPAAMCFTAPALGPRIFPTVVVGAVYATALIVGAALAGESLRVQTRTAHMRLHLQAWHLRQLVPVSS